MFMGSDPVALPDTGRRISHANAASSTLRLSFWGNRPKNISRSKVLVQWKFCLYLNKVVF